MYFTLLCILPSVCPPLPPASLSPLNHSAYLFSLSSFLSYTAKYILPYYARLWKSLTEEEGKNKDKT